MYVSALIADNPMRSRKPIPDVFRYGQRQKDSADDSQSVEHGDRGPLLHDMSDVLMPPSDVIIREFEEYLEVLSSISEEEEDRLRQLSVEEKWRKVYKQDSHAAKHSVRQYVENLRLYVQSARTSSESVAKSNVNNISCSLWLKKLKVDLKKSPNDFTEEFVKKPNHGISLLVSVLKRIVKDQENLQSIRKSRAEHLKNSLLDQYDCLLCIKFALKSKKAVRALLDCKEAVWDITLCLMSTFRKISLVVIEILTIVCDERNGFLHVIDAITNLRVKSMESVRFKLLTSMLHSQTNRHFQAVCVRFFNKLISCTDDANGKVYLQHELLQAGFDPDALDKYSLGESAEFSELQKELEVWRKNYINVDRDREELFQQQNRGSLLREEIDRLQNKIKEIEAALEKEKELKRKAEARANKMSEKAAEMQDVLGQVMKLYKERVGKDPTEEIEGLEYLYKPLDGYATVKDKFGTLSSNKSLSSNSLEQVMTPPPAPPVMPPAYLSNTVRRKVDIHVNLPLLNWTPIYSVRNTMFEDIDDEAKLRDIDFSEFDQIFQLPVKEVESRDRGDRIIQRMAKLVTCVEICKARNMIITIKRTGLSYNELREAVDLFQIDKLPGENAELLLKYVPTKEELKCLAANASEYNRMGEAEKYLFQMTKVDRLERKLSLLAFMGKFDDVIKHLKPEIEMIQKSSESLLNSVKLKKVFELVLAFGNYMNSAKKGYAFGFRLESLSKLQDVKSGDKSQTLLHYLARFIEKRYPELVNFGDELDLSVEKGVSYQSVVSDVLGLRRGMDLLRSEMEKNPKNKTLSTFYSLASPQVIETADRFRKMEEVYKKACAYFGEDYRQMEPDELVRYIAEFIAAFKKAREENHKEVSTSTSLQRRHESASTPKDARNEKHSAGTKAPAICRMRSEPAISPKPSPAESASASDGQSPKLGPFVTKIKVENGRSVERLNVGEYSEVPVARVQPSTSSSSTDSFSLQRHVSVANPGDIRLKGSHSFYYGAKTSGRDPSRSAIKKTPSLNANSVHAARVGFRQKDSISSSHGTSAGHAGAPPPVKQVHVVPICEEIPASAGQLANGFQQVNSETDSATTCSLSSLQTTPTNTSGSGSLTRYYPVTRLNAVGDADVDDKTDNSSDMTDSGDRNDNRAAIGNALYNQQVNDVIDSFDQLLDDQCPEGFVAVENEISHL